MNALDHLGVVLKGIEEIITDQNFYDYPEGYAAALKFYNDQKSIKCQECGHTGHLANRCGANMGENVICGCCLPLTPADRAFMAWLDKGEES